MLLTAIVDVANVFALAFVAFAFVDVASVDVPLMILLMQRETTRGSKLMHKRLHAK